jgi:hypothetical protein
MVAQEPGQFCWDQAVGWVGMRGRGRRWAGWVQLMPQKTKLCSVI